MKTILALSIIMASAMGMPAHAERFCSSSRWITMGGERVKVCCSNGVCTTKYGIYDNN